MKIGFSREVYINLDKARRLYGNRLTRALQEVLEPKPKETYTEAEKQKLSGLLKVDFATDEEDPRHTTLKEIKVLEASKLMIELKLIFDNPAAVTLDPNIPDKLTIEFDSEVF